MTETAEIRVPLDGDRAAWGQIYAAYAAGASVIADDAQADRVWGWIKSPEEATSCLVAAVDGGNFVGFVHWRRFPIPILGQMALYIDDVFVMPEHRGAGIARLLIDEVRHEAGRRDFYQVRWTTRPGNVAAQRLYERIGAQSDAITFTAEPI